MLVFRTTHDWRLSITITKSPYSAQIFTASSRAKSLGDVATEYSQWFGDASRPWHGTSFASDISLTAKIDGFPIKPGTVILVLTFSSSCTVDFDSLAQARLGVDSGYTGATGVYGTLPVCGVWAPPPTGFIYKTMPFYVPTPRDSTSFSGTGQPRSDNMASAASKNRLVACVRADAARYLEQVLSVCASPRVAFVVTQQMLQSGGGDNQGPQLCSVGQIDRQPVGIGLWTYTFEVVSGAAT